MSQYLPEDTPPVVIEHYGQLAGYFEQACKPRSAWRVGTEYEKIAVRRAGGHAVPFSGRGGIEELLERLAERYDWEPVLEEGRVVALRQDTTASITLEPGGQLELSGQPWASVHEAAREFREHVEQILAVGAELNIVFLGLGMQPRSTLEQIEWVPKRRYRIMAPYMERVGSLGHRMMKQTATVQANLDFASEADALAKLRVGLGITPLMTAMFANSPLCDGDLNGYMTFRGHIWTDTDADRSGLLRFPFDPAPGFADYVEYALDVPMYFIIRDGWIDMTAYTFRRFIEEGHAGHRATMADWNAHLTTLFPEVRLKGYIELRAADSQLPELVLAIPALAKGILYDEDAMAAAWNLVANWSWEERVAAYHSAHREALAARVRGVALGELCAELVRIAAEGLRRQQCLNRRGEDESIYLRRLAELLRQGTCPAEQVRERWLGEWNREMERLIAGTEYTRDAPVPWE